MGKDDLGPLLRDMKVLVLKLGGPMQAATLLVGLVVSLIQTVTQINEPTLAFVPKVLAVGLLLLFLGPFMLTTLSDATRQIFDRVVAAGGS